MIHILAQAAVTVTETVTNTPSPTVPVEIVKEPSSGWELKDYLSPLIAALALGVSVYTWKGQGAKPKFKASIFGHDAETAFIRINLVNFGRLTAIPSSIEVVGPNDKFLPVTKGDFVPFYKEDQIEQEPLPPGGMFIADMPLNELPSLVPKKSKNTTTLRSFYFDSNVSGKRKTFKVPRKEARKWQASFKNLTNEYWAKQESIRAEQPELADISTYEKLYPRKSLPKEEGLEKFMTWFRTLR